MENGPDESNPHAHTLFLSDPLHCYPTTEVQFSIHGSFPSGFPIKALN
jgi:hypothetical protein